MEITPEYIAQCYSACLDSVQLVNDALQNPQNYLDDETVVERNIVHLEFMLNKDFWTDEDMAPIVDVIALVRDEPV